MCTCDRVLIGALIGCAALMRCWAGDSNVLLWAGQAVAYRGMLDCFQRTLREEGFRALFKVGLLSRMPHLTTVVVCSSSFAPNPPGGEYVDTAEISLYTLAAEQMFPGGKHACRGAAAWASRDRAQ
jgi:hypothetical protein